MNVKDIDLRGIQSEDARDERVRTRLAELAPAERARFDRYARQMKIKRIGAAGLALLVHQTQLLLAICEQQPIDNGA